MSTQSAAPPIPASGVPIRSERRVAKGECTLLATAETRYPDSPRAGFELLRYGRVIAPDSLVPANAPAWEELDYPGGSGWVNLNGASVQKFSDADFPDFGTSAGLINGWGIVDATTNADLDSRCLEIPIRKYLDINQDKVVTDDEAHQTLDSSATEERLTHKICRFVTEWDAGSSDKLFKWLKDDPRTRMKGADYQSLLAHVQALCFWYAGSFGIEIAPWHFHPFGFISHMRNCGWLSPREFAQCLPRSSLQFHSAASTIWNVRVLLDWDTASQRANTFGDHLSAMMRTYLISTDRRRMAHFLAQALEESAFASALVERGGASRSYAPYFGRGFIQLTGANYEPYGKYRGFHVAHKSADPKWAKIGWDPDALIARSDTSYDPDAVMDTGGYYWLSSNGLSRSDNGLDIAHGISVSRMVNGGHTQLDINGLEVRLANLMHLKYTLTDSVRPASASDRPVESITFDWRADEEMTTWTDSKGKTHPTHKNGKTWTLDATLDPQRSPASP